MKFIAATLALMAQGPNWDYGMLAGRARVYRVVDDQMGVVCYVATTDSTVMVPSMQCLRFGPAVLGQK